VTGDTAEAFQKTAFTKMIHSKEVLFNPLLQWDQESWNIKAAVKEYLGGGDEIEEKHVLTFLSTMNMTGKDLFPLYFRGSYFGEENENPRKNFVPKKYPDGKLVRKKI
jgi:hypothetical protein